MQIFSKKTDTLFIKNDRDAKPKLDSIIEELPDLVQRYNGKIPVILRVIEEYYEIKVSSPTLQKYLGKTIPLVTD